MAKAKRQVIVTTERRGVFYGTLDSYDEERRVAVLKDAVMAIYWGTTHGLFQLANTGPTDKSRISQKANVRLEVVECIVDCSKEAEAAWTKYVK